MKFCSFIAGISALCIACGAALAAEDQKADSDTPPSGFKVDVMRGDQWSYEQRDGITDELKFIVSFTVTDVSDGEIDTRAKFRNVSSNAENSFLQTFDRAWRSKDTGNNVYHPAQDDGGVPDALAVGKSWKFTYEQARTNPVSSFKWIGNGKVEGWEKVTLPSGQSFNAFKIRFHEQVMPVMNNRKFENDDVEWYAPEINRYVKIVYEQRQNGKLSDSIIQYLKEYQPHSRN